MPSFDYSAETPRRWWESLVVFGVAVLAFGLLSLWSYPILHPSVWNDVAIAAGLRAPESPLNGLYRAFVHGLFLVLPTPVVLRGLPVLGRIVVACSAAGIYVVFMEIFPSTLRLTSHIGRLGTRIARIVALLAALLFLVADPIWRAGQTFSPVTLFIAENVLVWSMLFRSLRRGVVWPLYVCAVVLGSLTAGSPIGLPLSVLAAYVLIRAVSYAMDPRVPFVHPLVDSFMRAVTFVRLCNLWLATVALQIAADFWLFRSLGGLSASGCSATSDYLVVFAKAFWGELSSAATPTGWLFALLVCVIPLAIVLKLLPKAWDEDRFLPYAVGLLFAIVGFVSLSQVSGVRPFLFWLWVRDNPMVGSDQLLSLLLSLNVAVCAFSFAVFGIDSFCRNHQRIAKQVYPESVGTDRTLETMESVRRDRAFRRRLFVLLLVVVPVVVVWGRRQPRERGMMRVMGDYAGEVLTELGDRDLLFTDGSYDSWLELLAKGRGGSLRTLSLMGRNTPAETGVRLRVAESEEDRALLERGAATALRSWLAAGSPRLGKSGVQVGFEFWKREGGQQMPPLSGLMALPGDGLPEGEVVRSRVVCSDLTARIHALEKMYSLSSCSDRDVSRMFPFVVWRLSRLSVMHGRAFDKAGQRAEAFESAAVADELDGVNYALAQLYRDTRWLSRQSSGALMPTPREGLVIGLVRADFTLAAQFAQPVLRSDPDDPRANFAVGMKYYMEDQFARAEYHLARCLKKRPKEPAALNNLAMAQLKLDKLDQAEENVRKALALIPASREIQRTLESILAAKAKKVVPSTAQ